MNNTMELVDKLNNYQLLLYNPVNYITCFKSQTISSEQLCQPVTLASLYCTLSRAVCVDASNVTVHFISAGCPQRNSDSC
jgi:hypothetical protein